MQEVGLPDDYEYDEDNIYMQEAEKARRAGLSVAERKREDGSFIFLRSSSRIPEILR